jgi:4-hydroxy-tetrahydrodipicolinate synthase
MRACFYDTNPIPIKAVLHAMGLMEETVRLPLVPLEEATRRRVLEAFEAFLTPA